MPPVLLVFIDSFPYYYLDNAPFLSSLAHRARVVPGFGYSSTCQVELFSGLTPSDLGYFGEWTYDPGNSPFRRWRGLLKLLSPVRSFYYLDRAIHRVLEKAFKLPVKNIPLSYLGYFRQPYVSVFDEAFPHDSLLKLPNVRRVCSYDYGSLPWPEVDAAVYDRAKQLVSELQPGYHLVVSMTKLDAVGHRFGVDSPPYREKAQELDQWVEDLHNRFTARFPSGKLVVVSDHGMANVDRGVSLDIEGTFGAPRQGRYFYFLEGTLFRAWVAEDNLKDEIADYLHDLQIGSLLTRSERASSGLTAPGFADVIFVIHRPLMFAPSFWGGGRSKGMHGYHPADPTQHGIYLKSSNDSETVDCETELRATGVFSRLKALCENERV